jgi:hypothetical protein
MTNLGTQVKPSFYSALVSDYDPFAPKGNPPVTSNFIQHPPPTPYYYRDASKLFYIEQCHSNITRPLELIKHYFPPKYHFQPSEPGKDLEYYSDILIQEGSIKLETVYDRNTTTKNPLS